MLHSLDMSVLQRGSQSRADWCSRKFTLEPQRKVSWNHAQNSDDSLKSRWFGRTISHQSTSFLLLPSPQCVFSILSLLHQPLIIQVRMANTTHFFLVLCHISHLFDFITKLLTSASWAPSMPQISR